MFRCIKFFALMLALTLCASLGYSQEVRATITGTVTDSTDAAIAQAVVTVTNLERNSTVRTETNATGSYVTPFLAPGPYRLEVEAQGFKKYTRGNIVLQAQDRPRVDIRLELGELSQSVTVSEAVSQLQTETASRSQVVANEIIAAVPTQGRNPFQISWAASGVIKSGTFRYLRSFDIGGMSGLSINGGREKTNEVLMDGISNVRAEYTVISAPTTESVQEFKVQSATFDAQYGRTGGGIITIVTKGGGNSFHGTAFEYFQNDKLNANQSELNRPTTTADGKYWPNGRKPPNHINQFGIMASGPIVIPKLVNTKNRVFWMLSWESMRQRSADPGVVTFPTMDIRGGDFTSLLNGSGQPVTIYDPRSTKADGTRTPIPGNKIPSSAISPVAAKVLSYYPAPSAPGDGPAKINNYPFPSVWWASFDQFVGRTDVVVNSKNNVFFRYNENPFQEFRAIVFGMTNVAEPTGNAPLLRNGRNVMANWTSTLSPTMTFDLRVGLNRWEEAGGNSIGAGYNPSQLGFSSAITSQINRYQFPRFDFEAYQSAGSDAFGPGTRDTYSLQPNLNKVVGRHFMKFGADLRQFNRNDPARGYPSGYYYYGRNWTQANANRADAVSGNSIATFLMGIPSSAQIQKNAEPAWRHFYYGGFFQDDWKINSRLSLNFGLRWDTETGNSERYNRQVLGLDWAAPSPIASQVKGLTLTGATIFAGVGGQPTRLVDADENNWQPRVGLAYRLGEKWVLRGGYGLYYIGHDDNGSTNGFGRTTPAITSIDGLTPYPGMSTENAFVSYPNSKLLDPIGSSQGASSFLGEGMQGWIRNRALPYTHQFSFDIQRELPAGMLAEVGYSGNLGRRYNMAGGGVGSAGYGLNYIPTSELGRRTSTGAIDTAYYTALVPNPMAGLIPNNAALNGPTITRQTLWYAYPQYAGMTLTGVPIGKNRTDAVSFKITKRLSHGLSFLANYGIAKNLQQVRVLNAQDFGGLTNYDATRLVKESNQNVDTPQKFIIAGIYELPFGKGRAVATNASGVVNHIIGGWQLAYDVAYQTGWVADYPTANQNAPGSAKLDNPTNKMWYNTALWKTAAGTPVPTQEPYTLRNYPYLFSDVRRPGMKNWDVSMMKYFPIQESLKLQFRFEMVNMMNHPWFADIADGGNNITNAAFGQLNPTQRNLPRFIKLALHLNW